MHYLKVILSSFYAWFVVICGFQADPSQEVHRDWLQRPATHVAYMFLCVHRNATDMLLLSFIAVFYFIYCRAINAAIVKLLQYLFYFVLHEGTA